MLTIVSAGKMNWFEANKVTLAQIKTKYLLDAKEYLYFRKGEDWLKHFMSALIALAGGEESIRRFSASFPSSRGVSTYAEDFMDELKALDKVKCLDWLLAMGRHPIYSPESEYYESLQNEIWDRFVSWKKQARRITTNFQILCKGSKENRSYLSHWHAVGTMVKFYPEDTDAGSHRFYVNDTGYAVFWRQTEVSQTDEETDDKTHFYGFEGTDPQVTARLKRIFESEWDHAVPPEWMLP